MGAMIDHPRRAHGPVLRCESAIAGVGLVQCAQFTRAHPLQPGIRHNTVV